MSDGREKSAADFWAYNSIQSHPTLMYNVAWLSWVALLPPAVPLPSSGPSAGCQATQEGLLQPPEVRGQVLHQQLQICLR